MRVADYITDALYKAGGETVFLVTGGMIMHLTDALYQHKKQTFTACHHEQAAAMAAEAYGRYTNKLGVVYVTAGPAVLNSITGVAGAYVDSAPLIVVGGQSKSSLAKVRGPRQFPLQGFDTLSLMKHITKHAVFIDDVSKVKYEIEKAIFLATSGRKGPVYIELPIDIQSVTFNPDEYEGYGFEDNNLIDINGIEKTIEYLKNSQRPVVLAGAGIRSGNAIDELINFIEKRNIPIITSRLGMDIIDNDHPLFVGRPGTYGDRAANFSVQNCDLLLVLGCRLGIGLVGYDYQHFAKNAKIVMVDLDEQELIKPSVIPDIKIQMDVKSFINSLDNKLELYRNKNENWIKRTQNWKEKYPVDLPEYAELKNKINSYHFMRLLSEKAKNDSVFVVDTGSCFHVHAQSFKVKKGQRHIITGGLSTMGYSPASTGVAVASPGKEIYCISGDGSIQMNMQEMQTIVHNKLPVKFVVFNNNGYLLIRITQNNFQEGRMIGVDKDSGVSFPCLKKLAKAYGMKYMKITKNKQINKKLDELLKINEPIIVEVFTPENQLIIPRVASKQNTDGKMVSMPYDDMFPFLSREEYEDNTRKSE